MNYTPSRPDGTVDITKALDVNTEFDLSLQLWSYLVEKGAIPDPQAFIHPCPHMSIVWGEDNVKYLRQRFKEMSAHHCYRRNGVQRGSGQDHGIGAAHHGRPHRQRAVAVTRIISGSDVDYGALTQLLIQQLSRQTRFEIHYQKHVHDLVRQDDDSLAHRHARCRRQGALEHRGRVGFAFIDAGGEAIELLQKSSIPEGHSYGW